MSAAIQITSMTSIVPVAGRLTVYCSVEHFIPSGLTIGEMLNRLRAELVAAASTASVSVGSGASFDSAGVDIDDREQWVLEEFRSTTRVGIDMDDPDPWLSFSILNPRKFLAEMDEQFSRMQRMAARLIATNRPGVGLGGCGA